MGVAHHLTATGGINVTTSYWVEYLHLSFGVSKHAWIWMVPEQLVETDWSKFEKVQKMTEKIVWKSNISTNVTRGNNFWKIPCIRKLSRTNLQEHFWRQIQKYAFFVWCNRIKAVSGWSSSRYSYLVCIVFLYQWTHRQIIPSEGRSFSCLSGKVTSKTLHPRCIEYSLSVYLFL